MSMIGELVDRLRRESKSMGKYGVDYMATLLMQASDTIIMLSEKARADRPQGEWEIYVVSPFDGEDCRCSNCGKTGCAPYWNFCPNCGSRNITKGADDE